MLAIAAIGPLFCWPAVGQDSIGSGAPPTSSIVEALEKTQSQGRLHTPYQMLREYRLFGAKSSSADSKVVAEVNFRPPTSKDYKIQNSSGSKRGEQVVRRVLDHEVQATSNGSQSRTALTRDNYDFTFIAEEALDGQPCYLLQLKPKRKETDLISGKAWVDKQSFLVRRIEGEVAKTPSWWLKRVRVKLAFADLEGTWVQTNFEAVADVRMVGTHTLTSRILDYRGTNVVSSTRAPLRSANRSR
jgi:hypothetical protein